MIETTEVILKGIITLLILKLLDEGPKHGYELERLIEERLNYQLPKGSIYVILKHMRRKGLILPKTEKNAKGIEVKKYFITEKGKEFLISHKEPLTAVRRVINELIEFIEREEKLSVKKVNEIGQS